MLKRFVGYGLRVRLLPGTVIAAIQHSMTNGSKVPKVDIDGFLGYCAVRHINAPILELEMSVLRLTTAGGQGKSLEAP